MPIKSQAQWKYLAAKEPKLLHKWQKEDPRRFKSLPIKLKKAKT